MLKLLFIIGAILLLIIILFFTLIKWLNHSSPAYVLNMLKKSAEKSSIVFKENGEVKLDLLSSKMMPLASTVKIMVAIEYAYQVKEGTIDTEEKIALEELDKYYLPKLDGGAHEAWLNYANKNGSVKDGQITLREVVRGMIAFSSNANTEFLMRKLGIRHIESRMKKVGVKEHSPLYFFESSTFIPYELKNREFKDLSMKQAKDHIIQRIHHLDMEEWISLSTVINGKLATDDGYKAKVNVLDWWDIDFDRIFSEKFTQSTTFEYAMIMSRINNKEFPEQVQKELEYALGALMENPKNQQWLERAGKKGGSTQYILTDAMFAETKKGEKFELVVFFNHLQWYESRKLLSSLNEFELKLLSDEAYRKKVYKEMN